MQDDIQWNLSTAWALTSSLWQFIGFSPSTESQDINYKLRYEYFSATKCYYKQKFFMKLCKVLEESNWIISCVDEKLISMRVQDKLLCAGDEILIIKGSSEINISAIAKEGLNSYFLVAALSCDGRSLIYWQDGIWNKDLERDFLGRNELYYFYYCKANQARIHEYLRIKYYPAKYSGHYHVLENIWKYNRSCESTSDYFCNNGLPNRDTINEENKNTFVVESNEKLREKNEKNKFTVASLEAKITELEGKLKSYQSCQDQINELEISIGSLKYDNDLLKNENQELKLKANLHEKEKNEYKQIHKTNIEAIDQLKRNLSDKEDQNNKLGKDISISNETLANKNIELYEAMETNKLLQEKLKDLEEKNKISSSQALYDPENEIIKLFPNRKHGLPNFGNTCYLNSLLQIFASTPLLARKVESINSTFCSSLYLLLDSMFKDNSLKTIRNLTQDFRRNLMATYSNIEAYNQQDAKEVFNMILSKIEEDGGNLDLFSIGFHQEFICKTILKHRSEYHDIQIFLIIPPCHKDSVENYLYYLDTYYNSTQKLICSECKREVNTSIQLKKVDWPDYLILYFPTPPDRITDSIRINYEIIYEMYGAICYYQDEGSFHYTAFTRDENEWNEYNDEHVETKKIDPHVINLAFYCRKTYSRPIYSR